MNLIPVERIPERKRPWHDLQAALDTFADMEAEIVKVDVSREYASVLSAYKSLYVACFRSRHPIACVMRGNEIFLVKTT